eukprot:403375105
MVQNVSSVVMPIKFFLMMMEFLLVIFVAATRDEYIHSGISNINTFDSDTYKEADRSVLAASLIFIILLFLEFFTLIFGVSLLFNKVNVVQIVFHFIGCLSLIWQILDGSQYRTMWSLMVFFGFIPFALEVGVLFAACTKYRVIHNVEQLQRKKEQEAALRRQEYIKREQDMLNKVTGATGNIQNPAASAAPNTIKNTGATK